MFRRTRLDETALAAADGAADADELAAAHRQEDTPERGLFVGVGATATEVGVLQLHEGLVANHMVRHIRRRGPCQRGFKITGASSAS